MASVNGYHYVEMFASDGLHIGDDLFDEESCLKCTRTIKDSFVSCQMREIGQKQSHVRRVDASIFHAALTRDAHFVLRVLRNLEADEADYILNALVDSSSPAFVSNTWTQLPTTEEGEGKIFQMVAVIVSLGGNQELLRQLVDFHLDLTRKDDEGNSLLHLLVDISEDHPKNALSMYDVIQEVLTVDELKEMIHARNNNQETPLNLASSRWLPEMMHAILNTNNVYRFLLEENGTFNNFCYDVTEFEATKNAFGITPLCHLSVVPEKRLKRLDEFRLLSKEPFATSIEEVFHVGKIIARCWLMAWCVTAIPYIAALFWITRSSNTELKIALNCLIIIVALMSCISEVAYTPAVWPYVKLIIKNLRAGKQPVAMVFFYRSLQTLFYVNALVAHCIHLVCLPLVCSSKALQYAFLASQMCNIVNGILGVLFFTQLNNAMGHFLIVVEKMLFAVSSFVMLSFLYIIGFTLAFNFVASYTFLCPDLAASNSTGVAFSTYTRSVYETFILGLGVTAPQDWYFSSNAFANLTTFIYITNTVFNTLMMFNLMIAIMNQRMTELCEHTKSLVQLAQLSIYLFVEVRINSTRKIFKYPPHSRKRCLVNSSDGNRFFIYTIEPVRVPSDDN